jgi:glycosyltransferase involved in cell wall biosynthesis
MTPYPRHGDPPLVSIVLPTYNRADTLPRAIDSVLTQHQQDWELLVVDDGSQDGSCAQVQALAQGDPRIHLIRQANAGVAAARNTGLAAARGRFIAFLDSDDAWRPHFLSLTTAFLLAHPEAAWVSTAFEQDCGNGEPIPLPQDSLRAYAAFARSIGSRRLALPAGEQDDLLRAYPQREPLGDWAREALAQAELTDTPHHLYHADLFEAMRWGYLGWLPATVLTRPALARAGTFDTTLRSASDFPFLARLARHHRAHLIGVPSVTKHERAPSGRPLQQDHLATGSNAYRFEVNKMAQFRRVFDGGFDRDPELRRILCHYELYAGLAALRAGLRESALRHLRAGARWQPHLRRGYAWLALALLVPNGALAARAAEAVLHGADIAERLATGHTSLIDLGRKATGWFSGEA